MSDVERAATPPPMTSIPVPFVPPGAAVEDVFPGEQRTGRFGSHFVCSRSVESLVPTTPRTARRFRHRLRGMHALPSSGSDELRELSAVPAERILFVDLETAGLSAAPAFLVGLLRIEGDTMVVDQLFARDYPEEISELADAAQRLQEAAAVITFNGKSFDVPYLRDRMNYYGLPWSEPFHHVDLLPHARRRWKGAFPDCRLQTLETQVCGRRRTDDVPGELIPDRYHEYVDTRDAALVAPILHHNLLDLVTMVELLTALLGPDEADLRRPG